jgi:hypothetical protein
MGGPGAAVHAGADQQHAREPEPEIQRCASAVGRIEPRTNHAYQPRGQSHGADLGGQQREHEVTPRIWPEHVRVLVRDLPRATRLRGHGPRSRRGSRSGRAPRAHGMRGAPRRIRQRNGWERAVTRQPLQLSDHDCERIALTPDDPAPTARTDHPIALGHPPGAHFQTGFGPSSSFGQSAIGLQTPAASDGDSSWAERASR